MLLTAVHTIDDFHGEYRFLSNFGDCPNGVILADGIRYPTSEHAYAANKTLEPLQREKIATLPTPGQAKRAGRDVAIRADWEVVKDDAMRKIVFAKFDQNPGLKAKLLATGDAQLIEGNTWGDIYWGVCNGRGHNMLGKILMEVRDKLRIDI